MAVDELFTEHRCPPFAITYAFRSRKASSPPCSRHKTAARIPANQSLQRTRGSRRAPFKMEHRYKRHAGPSRPGAILQRGQSHCGGFGIGHGFTIRQAGRLAVVDASNALRQRYSAINAAALSVHSTIFEAAQLLQLAKECIGIE